MSAAGFLRSGNAKGLDPRIDAATSSPVSGFAKGVTSEKAAIAAAITEPWSNGQTEGQITELKLVKRQGRAGLDHLKARMLPAA